MKYDEKDYAYIEEITEKRFKSLERSVVCDSPRTTLEPAQRSGGGRICPSNGVIPASSAR